MVVDVCNFSQARFVTIMEDMKVKWERIRLKEKGRGNMNWLKKMMLFAGIGICAIGSMPANAQAKQVGEFQGRPIFDNKFGEVEITDGGASVDTTNRRLGFAAKHDPRTIGAVTAIEDQGNTNTCWAFATVAAAEANIIKKGYENNTLNLSENHLAYFFYHRATDPIGYTAGDKNTAGGLTSWAMNGGTLYGTSLSLATWSGLVKQTASEDYTAADAPNAMYVGAYKPAELPANACYNSDYIVKNVYYLNYSVNGIKQAITDYGAVAIGMYMGEEYYNSSTAAYYCNKEDGNHAVTIVGWDDNYSRMNFNSSCRPKNNGAWIVKNSYGTYFGDSGYMYMSYEDASILEMMVYDMERASAVQDNNYQHDGTGSALFIAAPSGSVVANVFQAKGSSAGYNELLEAVSINTNTANVNYSVQIYTGLTSTSNPTKGKAALSSPQRGTLINAGYNQIKLNNPVTLQKGEKYSVVITLSTANGSRIGVGVDKDYRNNYFNFDADIDKKVGYIKLNGKWYDCGNVNQMGYYGKDPYIFNLRIKAYTNNTAQKTSYKLSSKSASISKGSSQKLSLKITPGSIKRKVTWTSSNKKVATISSSGKIKAKAYGTTTIKAKFVGGSKTKTLTCKVTVGPAKVKSLKVKSSKKKMTLTWKKSNGASGYAISYSKSKDGSYKTLATVKSGSTTKYTKKMKKGTYYVKVRPYITQGKKKLYGSYTSVKKVTIK